ncbi:MAG: carboxypeptidase regulatory-like domain-containing protein, partial [Acidobacteria bacterium]|nr:carboxypeptidase regulatory-like domain-containing protein [Acidobacteriota bacterium]
MRRASIAALLFAFAWLAPGRAAAQTTNGVISGIVSDAQGGVLPGVTVTGRNVDTGITRTVVTESDGRFRLAALPPGRYELHAELSGFGTVDVPGLTLTTGTEVTRNMTMQVQGVSETVTVTGEAPIVEVTRSDVSGIITQDQMQMLPLATRQPMDLALLMPGTSQDAVRARKANSNVGAGAFTNGSALLVDGVWNKEGNTGEPRQDFPQSAIQEFKVLVSQSPAEYGWTAGGAVSMATKSGTNVLHGELFEFYRNKALNTMDPFAKAAGQPKPNFSRHQYGGAIGGPIVRDRLHFFQAAEVLQNNLYDSVVVRQPQFYGSMNGTFA